MQNGCIFCKIANGEIPSRSIYEDDLFRVILDLSPATKGHCLILPKDHYQDIFEIEGVALEKIYQVAKKVAIILKEKLQCSGVNIIQNNGTSAGQTVFHFHVHVIPRYEDDGEIIAWNPMSLTEEEFTEIFKTINE